MCSTLGFTQSIQFTPPETLEKTWLGFAVLRSGEEPLQAGGRFGSGEHSPGNELPH